MKKSLLIAAFCLAVTHLFAARVDTVTLYSKAMKKETKFVVILPEKALSQADKNKGYPVVYLLHGHGGNYAQWFRYAPQLVGKADELGMIFILADGGVNSWYFDSPVDSTVRYETMITKELIPYVDQHYPTSASRKQRAITGLSMGGHGGLYLAFRHTDLFGAAGSISGGVDIRPFPKNWQLDKVLGPIDAHPDNWNNNTVVSLADHVKNGEQKIIFDCGTSDFFIEVNRSLHQKLLSLKIDHDYTERPGGHTKEYWENSIDYQLLFFKKYFSAN